jgi:Superinfection immunity protein
MIDAYLNGVVRMVVLMFLISGYLLPSIVAGCRGRGSLPLYLLNVLLGWTFVGWLVALSFALRDERAAARVAG